jgi:aminoglycoside phosphotransferase (APT) family kinase protein
VATNWFGTPMVPLAGGYSGETFLVGGGGQPGGSEPGDDSVVLRIYRRDPARAAVDASLLRLVRGLVPVPAVLDVRIATDTEPGVLVTERLRGVALDRLLRDSPDDLDWDCLATSAGRVLATLSGIPFLRAGFFVDASLSVSPEPMPVDLVEWAHHHRTTSRIASWRDDDWHALLDLVEIALDGPSADGSPDAERVVLAHSDFNPKNLLVDPGTGDVTGLVDWEFAHAGSPFTDIGNVTRFERDPRLLEPLLEAFANRTPGELPDPFRSGRAADLWALIDLAGRPAGHPVGELASTLLLAQARSGDLAAWPWSARRVDPIGAKAVS